MTCKCDHYEFMHASSRRSPGNHCRVDGCACDGYWDPRINRAEHDRQEAEHQRFLEETPFGRWLSRGKRGGRTVPVSEHTRDGRPVQAHIRRIK